MNRRNTLLAIGGALPMVLAARALKAQPNMPVSVSTWMSGTLQYGTLAKATSQYALLRSSNSFVRDFAKGEIQEQTAFAQAITMTPNPAPYPLTAQQQAMLSSIANAPASTLDSQYIALQIQGHMMLQQLQIGLLADGLPYTNPAVQQATVALSFIENHLVALSLLQAYNQ